MGNLVREAARASTLFENTNTDLKRRYLIKNIDAINSIMKRMPGYCGSFGTGYPFYALGKGLEGSLPIIPEQIRYNDELFAAAAENGDTWTCARCLSRTGSCMPDLKQICKPCPKQNSELKPRKVLNRLPDVDMWMICEDSKIEEAKKKMVQLFEYVNMHTSDVDPVRTIGEISEIANDLSAGKMPHTMLPLDVHIIERSKMDFLISNMPFELNAAVNDNSKPYLSIHPYSLRKTWQKDDEAYNFVLDYMYTLTPFNWDNELQGKLDLSRQVIGAMFSEEDMESILHKVSSPAVERRFQSPELQKRYKERVGSWKK